MQQAGAGLKCEKCGTGFVPDKPYVEPPPLSKPAPQATSPELPESLEESHNEPTSPLARNRYEHIAIVLHFEKKGIAMTRQDVLQGLSPDSSSQLHELGNQGWELVSVIPYTTGGIGFWSNTSARSDAALAFFKRVV